MAKVKQMAEVTLIPADQAPVQQINKDEIEAAVKRMRAIVPNDGDMTTSQLTVIAQEAILYRIVPGRDVHYFVNRGKLERVMDYKYLKNYATFKEQLLSGDDSTTLDETYKPLSETERVSHGIADGAIAAACTITTARERKQYADEVARWRAMGAEFAEAVAMAERTYGSLGTTAVGVVASNASPPQGWSKMQLAEKLAFKNAVNRKYGIPTADEMRGMAFRMATRALPEDWKKVDPLEPVDIQAKMAQLEAMAREAKGDGLTAEQHAERLESNVTIMRNDADTAIGEDYQETDWQLFCNRISKHIAYFGSADEIDLALQEMKYAYDPKNEDHLVDALATWAEEKAAERLAAE